MKKLRIGELSQLVGVPASALRFWEERGITEPEKDGYNNYRLYTAGDSCRFLMARRYRSLGFPLQDVKAMVVEALPGDTALKLDRRLAELEVEAKKIAELRDELARYRRECQEARAELGVFVPAYLPAAQYIFTIELGRIVDDEAALELSKQWTDLLPLSTFALYIPPEAFSGATDYCVKWGFGMDEDKSPQDERFRVASCYPSGELEAGKPDGPSVESAPLSEASGCSASSPRGTAQKAADRPSPPATLRLEGASCVRTAFYRDDPRDLRRGELSGIVEAFRAAGYTASGPAIGRLLQIEREGESYRYLYSLYIPIE